MAGQPTDARRDEASSGADADALEVAFLPADLPHATVLEFLRAGELEPIGRLVSASNATLLCRIALAGAGPDGEPLEATCVYKPIRGEAPLWDFPDGTLAAREVAAYEVSEASGWSIVPPTVLRDGPFGEGMAQLWVDVDESIDVVELVRGGDERLRALALFDAVVNNADRKAGHVLPTGSGSLLACDHGVCFHREPKLRTVLWGWRGQAIRPAELTLLRALRGELDGELGASLARRLAPSEVTATVRRLDRLIATARFPVPDPDRPAVPWPWY